MGNRLIQTLVLVTLFLSGVTRAQDIQPQEILLKSWKRGTETVSSRRLEINLTPSESKYVAEIAGNSGKRYKLSIIHNPLSSVRTEHWKMELREIISKRKRKEVLGDNLLSTGRASASRHYFPREDFAAYLYPERESPRIWVGGTPWTEGFPFSPIKTRRIFRVEGFHLIIEVRSYQFSNTDESKLNRMELSIELQNA